MLLHLYDVEFVQIVNPFTTSKKKKRTHTKFIYTTLNLNPMSFLILFKHIYFQDLLM